MYNKIKPAHIINLNKQLSIKEIKYILNNLSRERYEYNNAKILMESLGAKRMPKIDFDLIEAFQNIYTYSDNYIILCKITNIFNKYVKVEENTWVYEPYFGEDELRSNGYELQFNLPIDLREKIIELSKKVIIQEQQKETPFYW